MKNPSLSGVILFNSFSSLVNSELRTSCFLSISNCVRCSGVLSFVSSGSGFISSGSIASGSVVSGSVVSGSCVSSCAFCASTSAASAPWTAPEFLPPTVFTGIGSPSSVFGSIVAWADGVVGSGSASGLAVGAPRTVVAWLLKSLNPFLTLSLVCGEGLTSSPIFADLNGSSPPTLTSWPGNSLPNFAVVYSSDASNLSSTSFFLFLGVEPCSAPRIKDDASGLSSGATTCIGVFRRYEIFFTP